MVESRRGMEQSGPYQHLSKLRGAVNKNNHSKSLISLALQKVKSKNKNRKNTSSDIDL